jgi:tRNA G10  N-methylase Trm11
VFEEFKEFNYSELRDENPELSEAELQSLLRREYDKL